MVKPLLSLGMMVKDEAANLRKTLDSCAPFIDRFTILDTGSTDGTQDVVREWQGSCGLPGLLIEEPFVDFATSRNRVLELEASAMNIPNAWSPSNASSAVFLLMLSGDETLVDGGALRSYLAQRADASHGGYCVLMHSGRGLFPSTRVLRIDAGWRYVGDPHELPEGPRHERNGPTVPGSRIVHAATDPQRRFKRVREYDLPRLQARAENEKADLEERAHAIFHLAQTHELLADEHTPKVPGGRWMAHRLQAMALYTARAEIGDNPFMTAYSWLCALRLAREIGNIYTVGEQIARLAHIIEMNPALPEARFMLAVCAAQIDARKGLFLSEEAARIAREASAAMAAGDQTLHFPVDVHIEYRALLVGAACARELKNEKRARELAERALAAGAPPELLQEFRE